jgi:hypothetical protein
MVQGGREVMKTWVVPTFVMLLLMVAAAELGAQADVRHTQVLFGPRLGVGATVVSADDFNTAMQGIYADSGRIYFPIYTEMGVEAQQLIALGESENTLSIREMFLLDGLDQGLAIPNVSMIVGFHSSSGLEFGLGPYVTIVAPSGELRLAAAVIYLVGYEIPMKGFSLPITVTMTPLPSYANPKISIVAGFSFSSLE